MTIFEIHNLTKVYKRGSSPANKNISLTIEQGDFLGVFGPNGAGKTTLVRQMAALLRPTSGDIRLFGTDIIRYPKIVPFHVGYYAQRTVALYNHTVREVLVITGVLRGMSVQAANREANLLIERFGLEKLEHKRLVNLSGGERRLSVLLSTFMASPSMLILDEPTNELDPVKRKEFWSFLEEVRSRGTTVLITTHNLVEAEQYIERVAIIDQGKLATIGTPGELKKQFNERVRLQLHLKEPILKEVEIALTNFPDCRHLKVGVWEITSSQADAPRLLAKVASDVGFQALDDFRLITPSMEDVYIHVTGKRWEELDGKPD